MSCNHFQHQLSECLDGRLPAGSRTVVMAHVASCADCARVWNEMQRVQDLVLSLPAQRTSRDFRATLWSRIDAGEGAPQVDFHEPVPLWAKLRYVLAGAAAAAVLLFAGRFLLKAEPPAAPRNDEIAMRAREEARGTPLHKREAHASSLDELQLFTPQNIVTAIAASTEGHAQALRERLCGQEQTPQAVFDQPEFQRAVMQLRTSTSLLRWLRAEGILHLENAALEADVRLLEHSLELVESSRDSRSLSAALCSLERVRIENLPRRVLIGFKEQGEFLREFKIQLERDPDAARMIRLEFAPPDAGGTGFFWIARGVQLR